MHALIEIVKANDLSGLLALFGPEAQDLVDTSDVATGRRNREVFVVAIAEGWRLADAGPDRKELVVGNEEWPFPVPLVRGAAGWSFDAAAGREEILARRIGRNELAVIEILPDLRRRRSAPTRARVTTASPRGSSRAVSRASRASRTGSTGRPGTGSRAVRSAT